MELNLLWKTMVYGQNYGTIPITMELRFTKEKNMVKNFDL